MIYKFIENNKYFNFIQYSVGPTSLTIYDSHLFKDENIKLNFLETICLENNLTRSIDSMMREWKAHNILYKFHIKRKSTQHTDLEYSQHRLFAIAYKLITKLFKE